MELAEDRPEKQAVAARRRRRNPAIVALLAVLLVGGSVAYMIYSTMSGGTALEYYMSVDEAMTQRGELSGKLVRLHGRVVAGTLQKKPGSLEHRFAIFAKDRWAEVNYRGLLPDAFKDCAEVVVNGRFAEGGEAFSAAKVVAKCPSKYDVKRGPASCGEALRAHVMASRGRRP